MKGSTISFIGVVVSAFGAVVAWYGSFVSSGEASAWKDKLLTKSDELAAKSDELSKKNDQLIAKSDDNAAKSEEIARVNRENAQLSQELVAYTTGGNSFFYLHLSDFGKPRPEAQIRNVGEYPVRDTQINVFDVTDQFSEIAARKLTAWKLNNEGRKDVTVTISHPLHTDKKLARFPFEEQPSHDSYAYFLYITNATGRYRQLIHLVNVGGTWKQAYHVEKILPDGTYKLEIQHFDTGYPETGNRILKR